MTKQSFQITRIIILGFTLLFLIIGCKGGDISSPLAPKFVNAQIDRIYTFQYTPESGGMLEQGTLSIAIQPKALEKPYSIEISTLKGEGIIGGIKLSPSGLVFRTPIMVTIPLTEPQEPGSSVPIRYRASENDEWVPATLTNGMPVNSLVSDDGLSCLMFIDHFSEYAILIWDIDLSNAHFTSDTVNCLNKPYGDGLITVPKDFAVFEDGLDQIIGINDETGFSYGFNTQLGLTPGIANDYVRQIGYEEIIENLILQPEFPDPDNMAQIQQLTNQVNILRDFFDFTFMTEHVTPDQAATVLARAGKILDPIDATDDIFTGLVHINVITRGQVEQNAVKYLGNLQRFNFAYKVALRIWWIADVVDFLELIERDAFFFVDATRDMLIVFALNYELAKERIDALEPLILASSDNALKQAFSINKAKFINDNWALIINLMEKIIEKYQQGLVLGVKTFISAIKLMDATLVLLTGSGIFAVIPGGQAIAALLFAAALIINAAEFYYDKLIIAYHTLLKCSLAATLRTTILGNVNYTEQQLLDMPPPQRRVAVHRLMMKIYLVYYFYEGMIGVYAQWDWTAGLLGWLGSIWPGVNWHDYWALRHQYFTARRDYWRSEYPKLFGLLAEVPPDKFPPVWDNSKGITDAIAGDEQVTVYWGTATDISSPPVEYLLYMDEDDQPWDQTPVMVSSNTPYTFTNLVNETTYWFGVRCCDSADPKNTDSNTNVLPATPAEIQFNPVDVTPPWLSLLPQDVFVEGDYAYIAGYYYGLHIFDISNPFNPIWVNWVDTPDWARDVQVLNGYAYVADDLSGLQIIDIEPPETAYIVKSIKTPNRAWGVHVSNGYAYVADYQAGLQIIDIEPPESAYIVKTVDTPGFAAGVHVSNGYAYVADWNEGLKIIDIDPLESAHIVKSVYIPDKARGVYVSNGYAYVANGNYLQIIDIEPPESAYIVKTVHTPGAGSVYVSNGYAYVAADFYGLHIIDIEPPGSAYIVRTVNTPGEAWGVHVSSGYAYVADLFSLQIVDIEPPDASYIVKSVDNLHYSYGVDVSNGYAYVTDGTLQIIDFEPLELAYIVKTVDTPGLAVGVHISNGYAYVTDGDLQIIDIEPPESAYIVKSVSTYGALDVHVSNGYAYVANGDSGLQIIDIEPPGSAYIVKSVYTPGTAIDIHVSNGYAYVAGGYSGLHIVDIEPPASAYIVKSVDTRDTAYGVDVSNGYAYVAVSDHNSGLQIIDIDPPESAYIVKSVDTPGNAKSVYISNGYAYVADYQSGLQIIDIEPTGYAHIVKSVKTQYRAEDVHVLNNCAYVADGYGCLRIIKLW